uniref:Syntaxin 8 n=1 Tax=Timema genevievae TaxID=629358 RepID=A0A7R9K4I2_TIMGE|nr:unnamed protein product [Timema genevievae]
MGRSRLAEHDACEKLLREIKEQLTIRSKEHKTSQEYARVSSSIRLRMKQYESEIQQLKEKLAQISASYTIRTFQEAERRSRQVEHLESQKIQLHKVFVDRRGVKLSGALGLPPPLLGYMPPKQVSRTPHFDKPCSRETEVLGTGRVGLKSWSVIVLDGASGILRSNLMHRPGPVFADMGTTGWGTDEPEDDRAQSEQHMSVNELRQQQQKMVKDQNEGLEILSKVISRQKEIAQTIGNEVDIQNGDRRHGSYMSVVVTIMLSCRHRVQQGHKITWILTTTDIGADTDIIGTCSTTLMYYIFSATDFPPLFESDIRVEDPWHIFF